jgi:hypothetical protein
VAQSVKNNFLPLVGYSLIEIQGLDRVPEGGGGVGVFPAVKGGEN